MVTANVSKAPTPTLLKRKLLLWLGWVVALASSQRKRCSMFIPNWCSLLIDALLEYAQRTGKSSSFGLSELSIEREVFLTMDVYDADFLDEYFLSLCDKQELE